MGRKPVLTRIPDRVQSDTVREDDQVEEARVVDDPSHAAGAEPEADENGLDYCPDCGEDLTPIPEDMRLVCPNCRVNLQEATGAGSEVREPGNGRGENGGTSTEGPTSTPDSYTKEKRTSADVSAPSSDSSPEMEHWGVAASAGVQHSLDTLINTIPGEILVLWAALEGAAELYGFPLWAYVLLLVVTVLATPVYVYRSIDSPDETSTELIESNVQWWQEANVKWQSVSATGAFLVWVYYLGGPFQAANLQDPALATVIVIIYPVLVVISPYYGSLLLYQLSNAGTGGT